MKILDMCCGGRMFWWDKENPLKIFQENGFTIDPGVFNNPISFSTTFSVRGQKYHANFHEYYGTLRVFAELEYATGGSREVCQFDINNILPFFWLFPQSHSTIQLSLF